MTFTKLFFPALFLAGVMTVGQSSTPPAGAQGSGAAAGAQGTNPQPPAPQASITNPKGKRLPNAKTKQEYDDYLAAANTSDAAGAEKLAREFEAKFPNSELLPLLYQAVMSRYQRADNSDKTLDMGRKVLQYDPDSIAALVMNATVLAERTRPTDIDRDPRLNEGNADARRALENIGSGNYILAPTATAEQVQQYKDQVTGMAYQALGMAEMERENYPAAEANLRKALESPTAKGDAIVWYRLALALDRQNKYPEANTAVTTAVALAPADSQVASMAKNEQSRLKQLIAAGPPAAAPKSNQPEPEIVQPK